MKKLLLIAGIFLCTISTKAQNQGDIGVNLYGGYTFDDKISENAISLEIKGAFQYGLGAEYYIRPTKSIELKYLGMSTSTPFYSPAGGAGQDNIGNDSSTVNYILIAGNNYFQAGNPKILPFAGLGLGVGWISGDNESHTGFAWDVKAGVKIKASDVISVKLHGYFQTIWASYGSDTYYYPPYGYVSYPNNSSIYQFGLGAALAFDFKR